MVRKSNNEKLSNIDEAWRLYNGKKFDDALTLFDKALESGTDKGALYGRACSLFRTTDLEGALADLSELLNLDSKNAKYLHTRALIFGANEEYDLAVKDMQYLFELHPDNGEVCCDLGGLYLIMEDYDKAGIFFERSADIDKSCPCAWFGKGIVALYKKEYKKSVEYLNITLKLSPKHVLALMARAEASFCLGQKKEALKDVLRSLSLDKGFFEEFREFLPEADDKNDDSLQKNERRKKDLDDEDAMEVY